MTTEEKLEEMESNIEQIMSVQEANGKKLDEVLVCLKGNDMGSHGLVKRIDELEGKFDIVQKTIDTEKTKSTIYMNIIKWLAAIIAALVITYMFNQIYTHK